MYATQLHSPRNTKCMAGVSTLLSRIPGKAVKRERQRFLPFEVDDQKALPHPGGAQLGHQPLLAVGNDFPQTDLEFRGVVGYWPGVA
ncbi:toxin [Mycobacterium tuberculosis]|nr:toxin [Mycobacterium tuberculosis]